MSIKKCKINGNIEYATRGEKLRNKKAKCIHCGARMFVKKFPNRQEYYFSLYEGEVHKDVCHYYEGARDIPEFKKGSPQNLIDHLSKPTKRKVGEQDSSVNGGGIKVPSNTGAGTKSSRITSLRQILKAGVYHESPESETCEGSDYRFIDFVVFAKWGSLIWSDNQDKDIGARIVDVRWFGSVPDCRNDEIEFIYEKKILRFKSFWKSAGDYRMVVFFLRCESCFSKIRNKLFTSQVRENGTYEDFVPKKEKLDVLAAADWKRLSRAECGELCPLHTCNVECRGAYLGDITTPKQVEIIPDGILRGKNGKN